MQNVSSVGFRLSPLQKLVWGDAGLRSGTSRASLALHGALDADKLRRAFATVAERHESLRTYFQTTRGFTAPFQLVRAEPRFGWQQVSAANGGAEVVGRFLAEPAPVPVDAEEEIFQVLLVELAPEDHRLAVRVPALCCDRASLELLVAEVAGAYAGTVPEEEPVQYADFSEWHNELLATPGEELEEARAFWVQPRPAQALPLCSRDAALGAREAEWPLTLAGGRVDDALLESCWVALLWRLTGQETVKIDTLLDGRPLDDLRHSIGLFARPLPLLAALEETTTFTELLARVQVARAELEPWQAYAPAETAPAAVAFAATTLPPEVAGGGLVFRYLVLESSAWPCALALRSRDGQLALGYDTGLYGEAEMARLAGYLARTVDAALRQPDAPVFAFDLVGSDERSHLLAVAEGERMDAGAQTFPQMFEAQAGLTPDAPAIRHEGTVLSYAESNAQANRLAARLRSLGVGLGVPVGLSLERSAEMIVALLGIVKAGGAYVPLLPDLPAARMAHQIAETGLRVIVSVTSLRPVLAAFEGTVVLLDGDGLAGEPAGNVAAGAGLDDPMYILYTSGSTGTPKGVEVTHGNVASYTGGILRALGLQALSAEPGLNFATVSTLGADLGNTCIFPPLVTGGCVTVVGYEAALDGALFAGLAEAAPVDVLKITPSNLSALLATGTADGVLPRRFLLVGGEACTWDLARQVLAAGRCRMLNHYGPTETTIGCLVNAIEPADAEAAATATVPLGRPLANMQVYVLDSLQRPVPTGAAGEICMSGPGVTRGYLGRPGETAERFVSNPLTPATGPLYRSGDRARVLADGKIEFLGRLDHQVKIRGYRVELLEVEALLAQAPGVERALVLLAEDEAGPFLTAYLVAPGVQFDAVQTHLRGHLPDYMLPREFVQLERVPLSANGKVDRAALAAMSASKLKPQSDLLAPRTPLEEQLAAIWKEALKLPELGVRDNFFDLGGHSLLATQIIARVRSGLGLSVSIRMLFEAPTIEALALAIESIPADDEDDELNDLLAELEGSPDNALPTAGR